MTSRDFIEVKEVFQTRGFKYFQEYLEKRIVLKREELSTLKSLNDFLEREQAIGAMFELQSLLPDFQSHVELKLKEAQNKETENVN